MDHLIAMETNVHSICVNVVIFKLFSMVSLGVFSRLMIGREPIDSDVDEEIESRS